MELMSLAVKLVLDSSEFEKGIESTEKNSSSVLSKIGKIAAAGGAAIAGIASAAAAAGKVLAKNVEEVAQYGDNIDKMSQKIGISAQAYQEWDAVMQHAGTSVDMLQSSMKILSTAAESNNEAFTELGLSLEDVSAMTQEELFAATIEGLQNVEDGTRRTYLASKLLGRGATELGPLLNMTAEETQELRDRVNELGGVMSDDAVKASAAYMDSLQDLKTAFDGTKRTLMAQFLPAFTRAMNGITRLMTGEGGAVEEITGAINSIAQEIPKLAERGIEIVTTLAHGIIEAIPSLADAAIEIVLSLADFIAENVGDLTRAAVKVITTLVTRLTEPKTLKRLVKAAIEIITSIAEALIDNVSELVGAALEIISNLVAYLSDPDNLVDMLEAGLEILAALGEALVNSVDEIGRRVPEIIEALFDFIVGNLFHLNGIGNKINDKIADDIEDGEDELASRLASYLGRVFSSVGRMIGLSVGFGDINAKIAESARSELGGGSGGGNSFAGGGASSHGYTYDYSSITGLTSPVGGVSVGSGGGRSGREENINITVQSVLDGDVIGETAYNYARSLQRGIG